MSDEERALLDRIIGLEDVSWGPDRSLVSHTRWNPNSIIAEPTECVSYCVRCKLEERILREFSRDDD